MAEEPIRIQYEKSTGVVTHIDRSGKKTVIPGLPPQASLKAVIARAKALNLEME